MHTLSVVEKSQLEAATEITAKQLKIAVDLHNRQFPGINNSEVLAAIIQALATNFAAAVAADHK
ncbi:hypothetical protein OPV09_17600 [Janthinobacterium sp. TB1-E2]|uniref:Uncharacterized protein n=1 Tax=Janthinobacterium aestuarii TaxID=2985511 RepID=A0ABZ2GJY9_9BURK